MWINSRKWTRLWADPEGLLLAEPGLAAVQTGRAAGSWSALSQGHREQRVVRIQQQPGSFQA